MISLLVDRSELGISPEPRPVVLIQLWLIHKEFPQDALSIMDSSMPKFGHSGFKNCAAKDHCHHVRPYDWLG